MRTAFQLSHANDDAGHNALAAAWWQRADELIAELPEGPEHAWHAWFLNRSCMAQGDLEAQQQHARRALELARRYGELNVEALALVDLSHVATARGESQTALDLIKRATSMALGGEIDIFATGMVFCNAIWACRCRGEWNRAHEHLAKLLQQPGVDCWAVDLAGSGGTFDRGDGGEILDASAREAYRRRAEELQAELAELDSASDPHNTERIRTELDAIARELAAAVGLGGRPRRAGSAVERARQSVTKGIRGAIRKIAGADAELGRYLEATIKTGTACRFAADLREPVEWVVGSSK